MNIALETFFAICADGSGTSTGFFYGVISFFITGVIVILLIDPILE
jgi:hypothetical protein